jgi:hypothetical protein
MSVRVSVSRSGQLAQSTYLAAWCQPTRTALYRARLVDRHEGLQRADKAREGCPTRPGCRFGGAEATDQAWCMSNSPTILYPRPAPLR